MRKAFSLLWVVLLAGTTYSQKQSVVTIAGGSLGGRTAVSASLNAPTSVVFDHDGNLYISDSRNCLIREVSTKGVITTFAGTGICGFSGDGKKATNAMLSTVNQLAFDSQGDLLVTDTDNNRIRMISPSGIISTVAGNGSRSYPGDGGPAVSAGLANPFGIALDSAGNLYISDIGNQAVRLVDAAGTIHTVAGNGTQGFSGDAGPATAAQLNFPEGLAFDSSGNLYIADSGNQRVRKVDTTGTITTIAGSGGFNGLSDGMPATSASLGAAVGVFAVGGQLYIASSSGVLRVDLGSGLIYTVGRNGGFLGDGGLASSAAFNSPAGISEDAQGNLFVADTANDRIREIALSSQVVTTVAGGFIGDGRHATDASLNFNFGGHFGFDASGNMYIADTFNNRVRKVTSKGTISTVAGTGLTGYFGDNGPATSALLNGPTAVAVDPAGNLYIVDNGNHAIRKVDTAGTITTFNIHSISPPFFFFFFQGGVLPGLIADPAGNLYLSDGLWAIWKIDPSGTATIVAGSEFNLGFGGDNGPATQALLFLPTGIALDSGGNLFICDWLNNRVRKVDTNGIITTFAGTGVGGFSGDGGPAVGANLSLPLDVAVDSAGNVYIADWDNFRIREVDQTGTIQTIAGSGGFGYNGERLSPTETNMFPAAAGFSPDGPLYFADWGSQRIRELRK